MGAVKLRVVDEGVDRTAIIEPTITTWEVNERRTRVAFWTNEKWASLPIQARPKDAQRQGDDGYSLLLPA